MPNNEEFKNYYEILQISKTASPAVIRAAYKTLVQKYHPDKNIGASNQPDPETMILLVREAYDVLSDELQRAEYDKRMEKFLSASDFSELKSNVGKNNVTTTRDIDKPPRENENSWELIIIVMIIITGIAFFLNKKGKDEIESPSSSTTYPTPEINTKNEPTPEQIKVQHDLAIANQKKRTISGFIKNLKIAMPPSEEGYSYCNQSIGVICRHHIIIPEIDVIVYENSADEIMKHINDNSNLIIGRVKSSLAKEQYTEFTTIDGSVALSRFISDAINKVAVGAIYNYHPNWSTQNLKGVEKVLFPKSFKIIDATSH